MEEFFDYMANRAYNSGKNEHLIDVKKYYENFFNPFPKVEGEWTFLRGRTSNDLVFDQFFLDYLNGKTFEGKPFPCPDFIENSRKAEEMFEEFFGPFFGFSSDISKGEQAQKELEAIFNCKIENYEDLKQGYKKWARKNHPDKNPENQQQATELFQKVGNLIKEVRIAKKWD